MTQSLFETQINILLEVGKGLKCGLTKRQLTEFFNGKENLILKNGIVLSSYGSKSNNEEDEQSKALVELAEKYLTNDEKFTFNNSIGGKTCIIVGKAASELARLAVCDIDDSKEFHSSKCDEKLTDVPCKFPRGRKLKHFGNRRIKDVVKNTH